MNRSDDFILQKTKTDESKKKNTRLKGSVLKMRDVGIVIPAAMVLWSPWTDVTVSGDSYSG